MKKIIFNMVTIFSLILTLTLIPTTINAQTKVVYTNTDFDVSPQSRDELYQDIYNTILVPHIQEAIEVYYKKPVSFDIFGVKTLQITRPQGYRAFTFVIKLQLLPFLGAHNSIGLDNITFKISPGEVKLVNFEHVKSFPIPDNLL